LRHAIEVRERMPATPLEEPGASPGVGARMLGAALEALLVVLEGARLVAGFLGQQAEESVSFARLLALLDVVRRKRSLLEDTLRRLATLNEAREHGVPALSFRELDEPRTRAAEDREPEESVETRRLLGDGARE